jgi:hypothetical protein
MTELPILKDWKKLIENQISRAAYTEADILKLIYLCQNYMGEIQPISQWVGQQHGFINQMQRILTDMYFTMFGIQPPPRPAEIPIPEIVLDTPETRKQTIREVALAITELGEDVSDEVVFEELKRRGMKMDLINPTATISTVLRGFKPQFEKVPGKRGIFRRQQ